MECLFADIGGRVHIEVCTPVELYTLKARQSNYIMLSISLQLKLHGLSVLLADRVWYDGILTVCSITDI
jgi:hypothetical protein